MKSNLLNRRRFFALFAGVCTLALLAAGEAYSVSGVTPAPSRAPAQSASTHPQRKIFFFTAEYDTLPTPGGMGEQERIRAELSRSIGYDTTVIVPGYRSNLWDESLRDKQTRVVDHVVVEAEREPGTGRVLRHAGFEVRELREPGKPVLWFLVHQPGQGESRYFENDPRLGMRYNSRDLDGEAFAVLSRAVAQLVVRRGFDAGFAADWHTGLLSAEIERLGRAPRTPGLHSTHVPAVIATIHNGGYTGEYGRELVDKAGLDWLQWKPPGHETEGLEYRGNVSMLKASLEKSTLILPVSRGYTEEVLDPRFTREMSGVYRRRSQEWALVPFDNPVDASSWNPSDGHKGTLPYAFTADDFSGKALGKADLQRRFFGEAGVDSRRPLFSSTSRLVDQKGWSYLVDAIGETARQHPEAQWVILGDMEGEFRPAVEELARKYPDRIRFLPFRENRTLEKPLTAYSDFNILVSKYEPFGMTPPASKLNGTLPVVARTGGMRSTVRDGVNGFHVDIAYEGSSDRVDVARSRENVSGVFAKVIGLYRTRFASIQKMRRAAMADDPSPELRKGEFMRLVEYAVQRGPSELEKAYGRRDSRHLPDANELSQALEHASVVNCLESSLTP